MPGFTEKIFQQLSKPKAIIWVTILLLVFSLWVTLRDKYLTSAKKQIEKGDEMFQQGRWNDAFYWYHLVDSADVIYSEVLKKQHLVDSLKEAEKVK